MTKPERDTLAIVTATVDPLRARPCLESWDKLARYTYPFYVVWTDLAGLSEKQRLEQARALDFPGSTTIVAETPGTVPAFALGVEAAFADGAETVLCLHDDVEIQEQDWDRWLAVQRHGPGGVRADLWTPRFAGFGGASQLGDPRIYKMDYDPMQLARGGFKSNLQDAEAHGRRTTSMERAVVFDGFSQLGTKEWFRDAWKWLADSGMVHHAYDAALGCLAARAKVQGYILPVKCRHLGGQTAVGSAAYNEWAKTQHPDGDQELWRRAHRIVYDSFRDQLPLQVK